MEEVMVLNIGWKQIEFGTDLATTLEKAGLQGKGLYQIYGRHHAYGADALLYIGKTVDGFAGRLSGRWEFIESSCQPKSIRVGQFLAPEAGKEHALNWDLSELDTKIEIAERLLIKAHSPAMNKQGTTGLFGKEDLEGKHYLILNWYDYGSLLPEVSTFRNSYRFWEFDQHVGGIDD
jgi:hypothetical protein